MEIAAISFAVDFTDCVKTKFYTENIRVGI